MRAALHALPLSTLLLFAQCGGSSAGQTDLSPSADTTDGGIQAGPLQVITIANTASQCTVTYSVDSLGDTILRAADVTVLAAVGSLVALSASPTTGSGAVTWSGVTTKDGSGATYVVTNSPNQIITACCAVSGGTGC